MLFNSFPFIFLFLPIATVVYALARRYVGQRIAQAFHLVASFFFYGYAKGSYVPLLAGSILFNWAIASWMGSAQNHTDTSASRRKMLLWIGLTANIILLCSFKYVNFFLQCFAFLNPQRHNLPNWEFPLGISFFTLTQIVYLVDTYQGLNAPNTLFDHATLVSFFPYVSSGPLSQPVFALKPNAFANYTRAALANKLEQDQVIDFTSDEFVDFRRNGENFKDGVHLTNEAVRRVIAVINERLNEWLIQTPVLSP